ncbi:GntR family transcriptional regulator [Nonomuraea antimicrobica]
MISEAGIQREFNVARTTARRAIQVLRSQGLVHTRQGEGTFVSVPGQAEVAGRQVPFYRHIAREIRERIQGGELAAGQQIPTEAELVRKYRAARETVRRAVALLRDEGWVYSVPHRGASCPGRRSGRSVEEISARPFTINRRRPLVNDRYCTPTGGRRSVSDY